MTRHGRQTRDKNRKRARIKKSYHAFTNHYRRTNLPASRVLELQRQNAIHAAPYRRGKYANQRAAS